MTEGEAETIRKRGIRKISLLGVKVDPQQALAWAAGYERLLIYFDVDVLTYVDVRLRRMSGAATV